MGSRDTRPISWVAAARKAFEAFPEGAQDETFAALTAAAEGRKLDTAKPMKGFGPGVLEIAVRYRTDAYRTVYALHLGETIWVLHAFQKKSTQGVKTPQKELDVIRERLKRIRRQVKQ